MDTMERCSASMVGGRGGSWGMGHVFFWSPSPSHSSIVVVEDTMLHIHLQTHHVRND